MRDVIVSWGLPEPNPYGAALQAVEVYLSADGGANFASSPEVPVTANQEILFEQQPFGDWIIRLIVRDTQGRRSAPVDTPFLVRSADPSSVQNVQVTLV